MEHQSTSQSHLFTRDTLSAPFIVDGALKHWPAKDWTVETLAETLGEKCFRCRLMPLERVTKGSPAWEAEGLYVECQLHHFSAWCQGRAEGDNPLAPFSPLDFSGYIDYKYMKDVFAELPHMLKEVQWSSLGLANMDGTQSTIWIGSQGASTPCHYDTYGFNLVAQVQGRMVSQHIGKPFVLHHLNRAFCRKVIPDECFSPHASKVLSACDCMYVIHLHRKRWVLFPPEASCNMYPTRIPYEESSVFSQVDLAFPNIKKFPCFKSTEPIVITLEPGQVLYVPRHWWHFVTCTQTAVSINTWVEVQEDKTSQLQESVTRLLASALIPYLSQTHETSAEDDWINPTEEIEPAASNIQYLKAALHSTMASQSHVAQMGTSPSEEHHSQNHEDTTINTQGMEAVTQVLDMQNDAITSCASTYKASVKIMSKNQEHLSQKCVSKKIPGGESEDIEPGSWTQTNRSLDTITFHESIDTRQCNKVNFDNSESLDQVTQTLHGTVVHSVDSPFTLSEFKEERLHSLTSHIQHCHCQPQKDLESQDRVREGQKRKSSVEILDSLEDQNSRELAVQLDSASIEMHSAIVTDQEPFQQIKKCRRESAKDSTTDFSETYKKKSGEDVLGRHITDISCSGGNSEDVQLSVYVPMPCCLQQYLKLVQQDCEDETIVLNGEEAEHSLQGTSTETKGEVQSDVYMEKALLKSVLHPDVVRLMVSKLQEQVRCMKKS